MNYLFGLAFFVLVSATSAFNVNITTFSNCDEIQEVEVSLTSVQYDIVNGLCDTIHGTYKVFIAEPILKYELWITVYQCAKSVTGQCNDNARKRIVPLHCSDLYGGDTSRIGPWTMISNAMEGSKCGESAGEFKLDTAVMKPEYLKDHIKLDENLPRYRLHMLFHKIGMDDENETLHVRGCANLEFDIIY